MRMDTIPQPMGPRLHMRVDFITVHSSVRTPAVWRSLLALIVELNASIMRCRDQRGGEPA